MPGFDQSSHKPLDVLSTATDQTGNRGTYTAIGLLQRPSNLVGQTAKLNTRRAKVEVGGGDAGRRYRSAHSLLRLRLQRLP